MQIAIISGKGGTGKTTVALSISELIKNCVRVDCDVDAANLNLFFKGKIIEKEKFYSGKTAIINKNKCIECGKCIKYCKFGAIKNYEIDNIKCEGCGVCNLVCPVGAIELKENYIADIVVEKLTNGTLIKANMKIGADGSGKLITALRNKIKSNSIAIIDSSPGIGCPVVASIVNTDLCLIVVEPTLSSLADLKRILLLTKKLKLRSVVCINKYDLNEKITKEIKNICFLEKIKIIGLIPYDDLVLKSISELKPIVLYENSIAGKAIIKITNNLLKEIKHENCTRT